jgi:hypothetical protein
MAEGYTGSLEITHVCVSERRYETREGNRRTFLVDQPPIAVLRSIHVRSLITKRLVVERSDLQLVLITINLTDYVS